jgi:ADP-L-glycero-D-manno-heptose 6-epimerase
MIVITGGAGFIGSNLVAALEQRGAAELAVVDHLGSGEKWRNLGKRELAALVPPEELFAWLERNGAAVEAVFHMGAISSTTEADADLVLASNFTLSQRLWHWCAAQGVRLIYASSAATYGDGSQGFDDDGSIPALAMLRPLNAYGWSKHLFDRWVARELAAGRPRPPQWAGLKFFNVYGPNEYHKGTMRSVVVQLFERIAQGEPAVLFRSHHPDYPDGGQLRDFVPVSDCVDIMLWLFDHPEVSGLYNCGTGRARSFKDLAEAVYHAMGRTPEIRYIDTPEALRPNYQYFTEARMERLAAAGCNHIPTPLEDGVARYVRDVLVPQDRYL